MHFATLILFAFAATSTTPPCDARRRNSRQASSSLNSLSWQTRVDGRRLRLPRETSSHLRKRYVVLGDYKPNQAYQACLMPGDRRGSCRHLQYCVLEDFRSSFPRFLDYLCIIERSFVGVCCPERPALGGFLAPSGDPGLLPPSVLQLPDATNAGGQGQEQRNPDPASTPPTTSTSRGCGVSSRASNRLVGGKPADPKEWPWMAAILKDVDIQFCGGVLITDRHVLTAAHCVAKYKPAELLVRLGEYDFTIREETRYRDFRVTEIRTHEDYQQDTYENDIAILKLHRPASFNSYIWPICLPPPKDDFENQTAIATGWGSVEFAGPVSDVLLEVEVPVWPQTKCVDAFTQPVFDTMMCAAEYEGGRDACQGDSGGPLMWQLPDRRWTTIGVISWGIRCGDPGLPGVYTRVNRYLAWIVKNSVF